MVATSEVEIALMSLDGVADAAVVPILQDDGGTRLVGYVAPDGSAPLSAWKLRRDLADPRADHDGAERLRRARHAATERS